jgi:hypothetical protein
LKALKWSMSSMSRASGSPASRVVRRSWSVSSNERLLARPVRPSVLAIPWSAVGAHDLSECEERDGGEGADRDRVDRAADAEPLRQVARHVEAAAPDARAIRELAEGDDLHRWP